MLAINQNSVALCLQIFMGDTSTTITSKRLSSLSVDLVSTISNMEKNVNFWNHQKHVQITCRLV